MIIAAFLLLGSCGKDFMDEKPDRRAVVPSSLEDCQAMADYTDVMNAFMPSLGEVGSDDYYVTYSTWNALTNASNRNGYLWNMEIFEGSISVDWNYRYRQIFYANNILEVLGGMKEVSDRTWYNSLKGTALFFRAFAHYQLAQVFSKPYIHKGDNSALGIPLRLTSDLNVKSVQSTVAEIYRQIVSDLEGALELLPEKSELKTRPNKTAASALLARIYLAMQEYVLAEKYAEQVLVAKGYSLMDYEELPVSSTYPIALYNMEVVFHSTLGGTPILANTRHVVDSALFDLYVATDMRKTVFFRKTSGLNRFRGSYAGSATYFNGLSLNEIYLISAECKVRRGEVNEGLMQLNTLLAKRYKANTFVPLAGLDLEKALAAVLKERRKELLFRGLRWTDLRRLNLDPETAQTLKREMEGKIYTIEPNSPNYIYPFPNNVIELAGLIQNKRN